MTLCLFMISNFFFFFFFFFNDTAPTEIYTLSLHDALPISAWKRAAWMSSRAVRARTLNPSSLAGALPPPRRAVITCPAKLDGDRKSTRLNSSHVRISYAVFCLKKKKKLNEPTTYSHQCICH